MRIGDLAARTGASVRSLRYYEEQDLLTSTRSAGGQRHYTEEDVERVTFVQRLYAAGLPGRTILELMPCRDAPLSDEITSVALERMAVQRDRISEQIEKLVQTRDVLDDVMATARARRRAIRAAAA
ncbi:MerR family transcriptional regulator [Streptomyces sp. NPDC057623]|uniref:MerR family transcriptional regulator n=1 Tax=Streptomyces sp. NPDC057623 TaxID=3346187 RepID=UPI00367FC8BE